MSTPEPEGSRREQRVEASVFAVAACALLFVLGGVSLAAGWELAGVAGWVWFVLCTPELLLVCALALDAPRSVDVGVLLVVVTGNLGGLALLIASLLTGEEQRALGRAAPPQRGGRVAYERHRLRAALLEP